MNDTHVSNLVAAIDRLTEAVQNLGGDTTTIQTYSPPSYIDPAPEVGAEVETVAPTPSAVGSPTISNLRDLAQALIDKGKIADIKKVNAAHGIKRISEAHPDQYASIHAQLLKELA